MKKHIFAKAELPYLFRNGERSYTYRRAYPRHISPIIGRREFKRSLRTKTHADIAQRYAVAHEEYEMIVADVLSGKSPSTSSRFTVEQLKSVSAAYGLPYKSANDLLQASNEEQAARFLLWDQEGRPTGKRMAAIFGELPEITTLDTAVQLYFDHIKEEFAGLNPRELAKKQNPKKQAVAEFQAFINDPERDIRKITKDDAKRFKAHLQERVLNGEYVPNTANKKIGHLKQILDVAFEERSIDLPNPFKGLKLTESKGKLPSFELAFIRRVWLSDPALSGMNDDLRMMLLTIIDTGCSAKELCGLRAGDIHLDGPVPCIDIRPTKERKLKTAHRSRKIPLIGFARVALTARPNGFERYQRPTGADDFSAAANKYLREHNLFPSSEHSVYSLRHMFKDRLRNHQVPPELQNSLMGHKDPTMGAHYGRGYTIEQVYEYLSRLEEDFDYERINDMLNGSVNGTSNAGR